MSDPENLDAAVFDLPKPEDLDPKGFLDRVLPSSIARRRGQFLAGVTRGAELADLERGFATLDTENFAAYVQQRLGDVGGRVLGLDQPPDPNES